MAVLCKSVNDAVDRQGVLVLKGVVYATNEMRRPL